MSKSLIVVLLLAACLGCQRNQLQRELELEGLALFDPQKLEDLVDSQRLELNSRLKTIEGLQESLKHSYLGYDLKKRLVGQSGDEILQSCLQRESQYSSPSYHHEFFDRLRQCLAPFQDSHMNLQKIIKSAHVLSPIGGSLWVNGKWYITTIRPALLDKLLSLGEITAIEREAIAPGTEILEVDGKDSEETLAEFKTFLSVSSPLSQTMEAADAYFFRNFSYPKSATLRLKLRTASGNELTVSLPWLSQSGADADLIETPVLLKRARIRPLGELGVTSALRKKRGFSLYEPVFSSLESEKVLMREDEPVLLTGIAQLHDQKVCYLQVLTFDIEPNDQLVIETTLAPGNFLGEVESFLRTCEQAKLALVLDLKRNGGGSLDLAEDLAALFDPKDGPEIFRAQTYSTRVGNVPLFQTLRLSGPKTTLRTELMGEAWLTAAQNKSDMTPWLLKRSADQKSAVFNGVVHVLTSPFCVSACEDVVRRFKAIGRGLIIGMPTNGTGFGYRSTDLAQAIWRSTTNGFQMVIPNQAFRYLFPKGAVNSQAGFKGQVLPLETAPVLENQPFEPDIRYDFQVRDFNGFDGYREFLARLIAGENRVGENRSGETH